MAGFTQRKDFFLVRKEFDLGKPPPFHFFHAYTVSPDEIAVLVEVPEALAKNSRYLGEMEVSLITPEIQPGESVKTPLHFKLPEGMTLLNPVTEEVTVTRKKK